MTPLVHVSDFLKGKADAPNYRHASASEMKKGENCGTCKAWDNSATEDPKTGYCKWYDFNCHADHICDAWAGKSVKKSEAMDPAWDVLKNTAIDPADESRSGMGRCKFCGSYAVNFNPYGIGECAECGRQNYR
jgi:hypothetical protein